MSNTRLIRLPEVKAITGLGRSSIYSRVAEGRFPAPIALDGRTTAWIEAEVRQWVQECINASRSFTGEPSTVPAVEGVHG